MRLSLRRPAPSPGRSFAAACSLTACLLLLPHPARAGTYVWQTTDPNTGSVTAQSPALSGGKFVCSFLSEDYRPLGNPATAYGNADDKGGQADCSGEIDTVYTWQPAPGQTMTTDPPPASVVVQEDCTAKTSGSNGSSGSSVPVTGVCDTGLGVSLPPSQLQGATISLGVQCSATRYKVMAGGPTVKLACSPRAECSGTYSQCDVRYTPTVYPITAGLQGATADPSAGNALNVLTGQQITATLNSPFPVTSYSWSVSGATSPNPFWTWDPTWPNPNYPTQFVALTAAQMTGSSFSFYDAHDADNVTVQCNATIQPPSGPPLSVTAKSRPLRYVKPPVNWVVGRSYIPLTPGFFSDMTGQDFGTTELWGPATVTDPPLFYNPANPNTAGFSVFVQVANLSRSNTRVPLNGKTATYSNLSVLSANGTTSSVSAPAGLDGVFPYYGGYYHNPDGTFSRTTGNYGWLDYNQGFSADQPDQPFVNHDQDSGGDAWNAATASDSFNTWIMYRPASVGGQGTIYVPLQTLTWSWGGTANLDHLSYWNVVQTPTFVPGTPSNTDTYPSWSLSIPLGPNLGP